MNIDEIRLVENHNLSKYFDLNMYGMGFDGIKNSPEIKIDDLELKFSIDEYRTAYKDIQSVCYDDNKIYMISNSLQLHVWDVLFQKHVSTYNLDRRKLDLSLKIEIKVSKRYVVVYNNIGQFGYVFDMNLSEYILDIDRKDYHNQHCQFSISFINDMLIHGTDWNKLDVTDLKNGRSILEKEGDMGDFFSCGISTSAKYIVNNGWVWHPVGAIAYWDIQSWLDGELDELSDKFVLPTDYLWDRSICWIDDTNIAVYGFCNDDIYVIDGVIIVNLESGSISNWFPGPSGKLFYDKYIISLDKGMSIWRISGERVFYSDSINPDLYVEDGKFIEILDNGRLRLYTFDNLRNIN